MTFLNHILTNCSLSENGKGLNGPLVLRPVVPKTLKLRVVSASSANNLEASHIHQALIGEAELGDDGQGNK